MADTDDMRTRPVLASVARILSAISTAALYIAGTGLVAMSLIILWQVVVRRLGWTNSWTDITATLIMGWFIFLGAAVGVREKYHLGFDVLLYVLPKGSKRALRTLSDIAILGFAVGMVVFGTQLMLLQWNERLPALGISGALRYLPVAMGGVLISLFSLERIVMRFAGIDVDTDLNLDTEAPEMTEVRKV